MIRSLIVSVLLTTAVCTISARAQEAAPAEAATNAVVEAAAEAEAATEETPAEAPKTNHFDEVKEFLRELGPVCGLGFAFLSVLGLGSILERFANLRRRHVVPDGFTAQVVAHGKKGEFDAVRQLCEGSSSMLARVTETVLDHRSSNDYQEVKLFAYDKASREIRLEGRKSSIIAIVATVAPMLGLFGTVLGLRDAFGRVAAVGDMGNPAILADSINLALVTTVVGLALAMPALLVYNYFKDRLALYTVILEEEIADLVNSLFVKR